MVTGPEFIPPYFFGLGPWGSHDPIADRRNAPRGLGGHRLHQERQECAMCGLPYDEWRPTSRCPGPR